MVMDQTEILEKIAKIKQEIDQEQLDIIKEKIYERRLHLHKSHRNVFLRKIIQLFRKKLLKEVGFILEPILENQKEINLRLLRKLEQLNHLYRQQEMEYQPGNDDKKNSTDGGQSSA